MTIKWRSESAEVFLGETRNAYQSLVGNPHRRLKRRWISARMWSAVNSAQGTSCLRQKSVLRKRSFNEYIKVNAVRVAVRSPVLTFHPQINFGIW